MSNITPGFFPFPGTYTGPQLVSISYPTPGATIYYTTDGSQPTSASKVFTAPIKVSTTQTISALAAIGNALSPVLTGSFVIALPAATPTFSVPGGTYSTALAVVIKDSTIGAVVYYTTDGTVPSASSPVYESPIAINASEDIKAIAIAPAGSASPVATASYVIDTPPVAPFFSPGSGTYSKTQAVTITDSTPGASIFYTVDGSHPTSMSTLYSAPIPVTVTEIVSAVAISKDGSLSPISKAVYTLSPAPSTPVFSLPSGTYLTPQTVTVSDATSAATIYFTRDGTAPTRSSGVYKAPFEIKLNTTLTVAALGTDGAFSPTATAIYTITPPAATPTFSLTPGTYINPQMVVIKDSTPEAEIYYTTNGSIPTFASNRYKSAIEIGSNQTLKAVATAPGGSPSPLASATYTITPPASAPVFSLPSGSYLTPQSVSISDTTSGAAIYFTRDGTKPTLSSGIYRAPFEIKVNTVLTVAALAKGGSFSPTATATYNITPPAATPTFNVAPGTYINPQKVSIKDATPAAIIYYTVDGSTPSAASDVYDGAVTISTSQTLKAIALASGGSYSPVATAGYDITPPAATPTFSVAPGTYINPQKVSIKDATPAAIIYYTVDGSTPTSTSNVYGAAINIGTSQTLKAVALASGGSYSPIAAAGYDITPPAATPIFSLPSGTFVTSQSITISDATPEAVIYFTRDGTIPTLSSGIYRAPFEIKSNTILTVAALAKGGSFSPAATATYTITPPAAAPSFSVASGTFIRTQQVSIRDTTPGSTVYYTSDGTFPTTSSTSYTAPLTISSSQTLVAVAIAPGGSLSPTSSVSYIIQPPAQTPTFNLAPGTYITPHTVAISDTTSGSLLYYTTDGTNPSIASNLYTGPITVSSTQTICAGAIASGGSFSPIARATYTITPPAATPVISLATGSYVNTQTVTVSDATPNAVIYFTRDGSIPTVSSGIYRAPFIINSNTTLTVAALAKGGSFSAPATATFTITPPAAIPYFSVASGTYNTAQSVMIRDSTSAAVIHYTLDGAIPTSASSTYVGPIVVSATQTIMAAAIAASGTFSPVASANYTIKPPALAPVFSISSGTFTVAQTLSIMDGTAGASIYFTTDGSKPTATSTLYTAPITVSSTETLTAMALAPGGSPSPTSSIVCTITPPAAMPTFSSAPGTYVNAQSIIISDTTPGAVIYFTTDGSAPTLSSGVYRGPINIAATKTLTALALAKGGVASPLAVAAYTINLPTGAPIFSVPTGTYLTSQSVSIRNTTGGANIFYTLDGSTPTIQSSLYSGPVIINSNGTLSAIAIAPGDSVSPVTMASYTITPPAATPVVSIPAGTYIYSQSIAISDATAGATIYYTTDGTLPSLSSSLYSAPIVVNSTEIVAAAAIASGYSISAAVTATYTITPPAATPILSLASGNYSNAQVVTVNDLTPGAVIYFTTDGSTPTSASSVYNAPISVAGTEMVSANAIAPNYSLSAVASSVFTIASSSFQYESVSFSYTLPTSTSSVPPATSAGIFDATGALVKTLWSAQLNDQFGNPYQNGQTYQGSYSGPFNNQYVIRVLSSNVNYQWDGVIGNTSATSIASASANCTSTALLVSPFCSTSTSTDTAANPFTFAYQWGSFGFGNITNLSLAFAGNAGWAGTGYAEEAYNIAAFADVAPNYPMVPVITGISPSSSSGLGAIDSAHEQNISFNSVATDNNFVYMANGSAWYGNSYVTAFNAGTFQPVTRTQWPNATQGTGVSAAWYNHTGSFANPNQYPTGATVEVVDSGPRCDGQRGFDDTGRTLASAPEPSPATNPFYALPGSIAVQFQGDVLAVGHIAGNCKYSYNSSAATITGSIAVPAGVAAIGNTVSANSQTSIRLFSKSTGAAIATLPAINPTQMAFSSTGLWVLNQSLDLGSAVDTSRTTYPIYLKTQKKSNPNHLQFISFSGTTPSVSTIDPIQGLSNPVALAVNKTNDHVYVLDGGANQVMFEYAPSNLTVPVAVYGVIGGYLDGNVRISSDRLLLDGSATVGDFSSTSSKIAVEDDGDIWITDGGNFRILHISPPGNGECTIPPGSPELSYCYVEQISQLHPNYTMTLDGSDPTRMFIGMMEYQVDGTQTLTPGDLSNNPTPAWELLNNWSVMAPLSSSAKNLVPYVNISQAWDYTDATGSTTFATALTSDTVQNPTILFRLPPATTGSNGGPFQPPMTIVTNNIGSVSLITHPNSQQVTAQNFSSASNPYGSLTSYRFTAGGLFQVLNHPFDGSALLPHWKDGLVVGGINISENYSVAPRSGYPWGGWGQGADVLPSSNGVYPVFQQQENSLNGKSVYLPGFPHFAGINPAVSTTSYAFEVMPELCLNSYSPGETGFFPYPGTFGCSASDDSFGNHDGVGVSTSGSTFFVGYDGQDSAWGDQFLHYNDDGLLIGQFGNSPASDLSQGAGSPYSLVLARAYTPQLGSGAAENIAEFQTTPLNINGNVTLYHTDESPYGGVHRWTVSNMNSITETNATINSVSLYSFNARR